MFKTALTDINKTAISIDKVNSISKSGNTFNYAEFGPAIEGLNAKQAKFALSNHPNIKDINLEQVVEDNGLMKKYGANALIEEGFISPESTLLGPTKEIDAEDFRKSILDSAQNKKKAKKYLKKELNITKNMPEVDHKIVLNKALMDEAVNRGVLSEEKAASILNSYGVIEADKAETASKKSLAKATWQQTSALMKSVAIIGAAVIAYNLIRKATHIDTYEKLSNKIEELSNQYSENERHLTTINSQLEENYKRIQEIVNLDNPTYVENEELEKLKEANQYLEQNKSYLEKAQQNIKNEKNDALYQKYYGEYLTNDAKEADVINKSGNPLNWFNKDFQENFTEVTGWKWKNPLTTIKNEMDNEDGIFGKVGGAVEGIKKVQKQFRGIDTLTNVAADFLDDFSLDSTFPELVAQRFGFEQVNPSVLTPDMQTAETIKDVENLRTAQKESFTQDDEKTQQLEEKIEQLKATRAELSNSLMEAYETDPNFESPVSQMLLEQISKIDKGINPEQWEKDTFDNIFTSNNNEGAVRELKNKFKESFDTITYEDLIGENITSQLAKALYGNTSDESLKRAASLLFARLRTTFDKQSNNLSALLSFDEIFNSSNFKDAKEKLLELATSGELTPKTISSTEEYKKLIDQTGLSAEKLAEKIKKFNIDDKSSNIDYLEGVLSDMEAGKTMDISKVSKLISDNESLAGSIKKVGDSYTIEEAALESLINSNLEQYNIAISNQNQETKTAIDETEKRIKAYEAEMDAYIAKNELYGHASPAGYNGGTFTTEEQKTQGLWQTKANLEKEQKALDKLKQSQNKLKLKDSFSDKDKKKNSSQMNFIELLLDRVSKATEKIKKSFEDAFSLIGAKQNLTKALVQIQKEIQTNSSAYAKYMAKANKVGLDKTYVLQIQNGSLNIKDFDSDNDSESEIYDKIQSYQQWYEKAQACKDTIDNLRESEQSLKESYVDKIKEYYDRKTKTYQNKIDATNDFVSMNEDIYGYASSSLYNTAMKNTSKSISVYRKELSTLQKEQKLVNKSTNPTLWYKYLDAIDEAKSSVNDLADSYLSLAKSKAEAAITKRDAKLEKLNNTKSLNDSKINNKIGYSKKNSIISNNIYTEKEILSQYKTAKEEGTKAFKNEKKESSTKAFQKTLAKSGISKALIEKANHAVKQGTKIPAKVLNALKKNLSGNKNAENAYKQFLEYNTALNIKDTSASDYAKQNQESKSNIKQYQQQLLDQISEDFDLRIKAIQDKQSLLEAQWDKMEAAGTEKTEQYYKKSIQNSKQENALLQKEQKALYKQLTSNKWNKNSKEYKDAKSRLNDINVQIQNNTKTQIEWNNAMLNMPIDKLSKALGLMEAISNANKSIMDYYKTVRGYSTESDFKNQISDNSKQIEIQKGLYELYTERAAKAAISGSWLGKSYEEWMQEAQNAKGSIFDFQTENENLKDSLHDEVYLKPFEDMIEYSQRALDKIKDMESLFSTFDFTLYDEKGNLNEYGLAQMKTTFHQLSKTKTVLSSIVDEMKKLDELYADPDSGMNAIEHQEKKIELVDKYNSTLLESANIMKTITDMMKEQTKQQIDSIKKQIEAYKNLLSTQKEENSYQKSIKDKTDTISSLQKRLLALGNSSTEETQAEYQKVLNELETAKDDLEETEWEHYIDMQIQALDDLSESLDDYLNNIDITLESILETLNNAKGIVADVDSSQLLNKLLELVGGDKNIFSGSNTSTPPKQSITKTDLQNWVNNEITRTKKEFNSKTASGKLGSHLNASEYQHVQQLSKYFTSLESLLDSKDYDGLLKIYNNSNGTEYYMSNPNAVDTKNASIIEDIAEFIKKIGGINDMGGYFSNTIDTLNQFIHSYDKTERENHLKAITNGLNNTLNLMRYHGENEKANKLESYLIPYLKNIGINLPGFSQGGIVEQVARNSDDGIVSLKATEAFLSENEIAFLKKIDLIHPIIPSLIDDLSHLNYSLASTDSAQSNSIENVNINLECPAVTKEELYSWLQDTRTQKIIQSSVIDPIMGNGTFGRYQH